MQIAETERLVLRHLAPGDAGFYCRLLNEPAWLAHIGDRKVRSPADAEAHLRMHILPAYAQHGLGMYLVQRKADRHPVGICGLVRREALPAADIGFALLEAHAGQGLAHEAALAVLQHAFADLRLDCVLAITSPANLRSTRLLARLGFAVQGMVQLGDRSVQLHRLAATEQPACATLGP